MNCRIKNADSPAPRAALRPAPHLTHHAPRITPSPCAHAAFSLLEVMIASGLFFVCIFAILAMISNVLRNARSLRRVDLDAGMVAAQVSNTNKLTEGSQSGDFGNLYQEYSWEADQYEVGTNGLWQVDIVVHRRGLQKPADVMSIWLFRPDSPRR